MYQQLLPKILRKISCSALAVLILASLYGCGNKGDLYLPEDTATTYRNLTDTLHSEQ
jgi:predicted small lipoprotein YifL